MIRVELPSEVWVKPTEKLVYITPEVESALPATVQAFETVNERFAADPEAHLKKLEESLFSFKSTTGARIDCSIIPGQGKEMLMMWAPFSDGQPNSDAATIFQYISDDTTSKLTAAPNSWNQTTKSGVVSELLKAVNREMTVLTIYSPLPSFPNSAYTPDEYLKIRRGDFTPSTRIAIEAIEEVQDRLHGKKSETQFEAVHLHGASLGASSAVGVANGLVRIAAHAVRSVTAQELIVAPRNVFPELAARFTVKDPVGEPSAYIAADTSWPVIAEPLIRQQIDGRGNEPMMFARMLQGMSKISRLKGLTRPGRNMTPHLIENLVASGVMVTIPLAENSGLTHDTPDYLPRSGEDIIKVRATEGQRTSHLIDEYVALTSLLAVMNIRRASR